MRGLPRTKGVCMAKALAWTLVLLFLSASTTAPTAADSLPAASSSGRTFVCPLCPLGDTTSGGRPTYDGDRCVVSDGRCDFSV